MRGRRGSERIRAPAFERVARGDVALPQGALDRLTVEMGGDESQGKRVASPGRIDNSIDWRLPFVEAAVVRVEKQSSLRPALQRDEPQSPARQPRQHNAGIPSGV